MKFNRLYTLLAGAALTVAVAGGYVHYKWQQVETLTNKGPTRLFTVEKGAHAARLIAELGEGETSPWAVRLWLRGHPELVAIKSGTYEIKEGAPLKETLSLFASGKEFHFSLTFVEGSRFEDWLKQLASAPYLERLTVEQSEADLAQELGIDMANWRGGSCRKLTLIPPMPAIFPSCAAPIRTCGPSCSRAGTSARPICLTRPLTRR